MDLIIIGRMDLLMDWFTVGCIDGFIDGRMDLSMIWFMY